MSDEIFIYFSDLHIDVGDRTHNDHVFLEVEDIVENNQDSISNVLLAGDLAQACNMDDIVEFFENLSPMVDRIFYCLGNHEFYNGIIDTVVTDVKNALKKFSNVHVLENETVEYDDFVIIGSVFWTNFKNNDVSCMKIAEDCLNDFKSIRYNLSDIRDLKPIDVLGMHNESFRHIMTSMNEYLGYDKKIIVMTHHSPINCHNRILEGLDYAFCNEYENIIAYGGLQADYWIFGHTHIQYDATFGNTRILSNGLGYDHEPMKTLECSWFKL